MSSQTQPEAPAASDRPLEVVVISHSPYFYWWPLWLVGFVLAGASYWQGHRVAFVPDGTTAERGAQVTGHEGARDILITPANQKLPTTDDANELKQPRMRMLASNNAGLIWAVLLCVLVVNTHIQLRGVWSVIAVLLVLLLTVVFAIFRLWDGIFVLIQGADIHITASGYLTISLALFVIWVLTFFLYDRRQYMIFTRGQLRVRLAVGAGETVYDTRGMVVRKHRDALFRHWVLGFGSGDLTIHIAGTSARQYDMPNVLAIDRRLALINTMLQEREVVKAR